MNAQQIIDEVSEEMDKKYDVIKLERELIKNAQLNNRRLKTNATNNQRSSTDL